MDIQKVYIDNRQMVFNHVMSIVKDYHDSEEVCNDVFLKMIRLNKNPLTAFDESKSALRTWIRTITNSVILDYFRTNHQDHYKAVSNFVADDSKEENKVYFQFVAPKSTNADKMVLTEELQDKIVKAFHDLKPKYRRVAVLYFIHGHEYGEIAEMLNVPMGTVKGMLFRSRAMLQGSLKGTYVLRKVKEVEKA